MVPATPRATAVNKSNASILAIMIKRICFSFVTYEQPQGSGWFAAESSYRLSVEKKNTS
jgi:hypothetical protein